MKLLWNTLLRNYNAVIANLLFLKIYPFIYIVAQIFHNI